MHCMMFCSKWTVWQATAVMGCNISVCLRNNMCATGFLFAFNVCAHGVFLKLNVCADGFLLTLTICADGFLFTLVYVLVGLTYTQYMCWWASSNNQ